MFRLYRGTPISTTSGTQSERGASLKLRLDRAWGLLTRAEMRMATGKLQTALDDLNQAIRIDENFVEALVTRGYLNYLREDFAGALSDLKTAGNRAEKGLVIVYLEKLRSRLPRSGKRSSRKHPAMERGTLSHP